MTTPYDHTKNPTELTGERFGTYFLTGPIEAPRCIGFMPHALDTELFTSHLPNNDDEADDNPIERSYSLPRLQSDYVSDVCALIAGDWAGTQRGFFTNEQGMFSPAECAFLPAPGSNAFVVWCSPDGTMYDMQGSETFGGLVYYWAPMLVKCEYATMPILGIATEAAS